MINSAVLIGRLTKDVELRKTPTGKEVVNFTIAVDRNLRGEDRNNPNVTKADFIAIVAWNHVANYVHMYCGQGDLIAVKGRLNTRSYEDPMVKGRKLYITEVLADSIDNLKKAGTKPTTPVQPKPAEPWADDIAPEDLPF